MSDPSIARRQFLAAVGATGSTALLGAGLLLGSNNTANAQTTIGSTPTPLPPGIKSIAGSWFGEIKGPDGSVLFRGMATFMPGGGMMTTGQNDITPTEFRGTGHGVWRQDGQHVDNRLLKFIYNADLELVSILEELLSGDMDESGDVFVADAIVNIYDLDGNLLVTRTGSVTATRLLVNDSFGVG